MRNRCDLLVITETQIEGVPVARILKKSVLVLSASIAAGLMLASQAAYAAAAGDAKSGEGVFMDNCGVCHTAAKGAAPKIGPNLYGVVGRKSATGAGYMYSPAMMKAGLTWDAATLQVFLMGPQKKVPGTKMGFPGFSDPQDEADVIAYLTTLK
jgi:cytochrome c